MNDEGWRRLHPLSPVVRGGRATYGLLIIFVPTLIAGRASNRHFLFDLVPVVLVIVLGFVSWLVTRWRVEGDDLQLETGLIRRHSERYPLSQLQAIDIVRPGLARMLKVAELRLRIGGSSGAHARLAYLPEQEAEPLREHLLALAQRARGGEPPTPAESEPGEGEREEHEERVLMTVPTGRLAASILISDVGIMAELVAVALIVTAVVSTHAAVAVTTFGLVWIVGAVHAVWTRFNQQYHLSVAETRDGLRIHSGLVALTTETIRPGRVQAVRMVEPLLWRRFGWCRLELDLAGRQRKKGEGGAAGRRLRTVLPVGSRALADELLDRLLPDRPREQSRAPRRVRWKSPLRYRWLAWGETPTCVVTTSGRFRRVTSWVPLEKVQSLRRVQGPTQRRLRLASVHLDTAGSNVHATLRDRDVDEADRVFAELRDLARDARQSDAQERPNRRPSSPGLFGSAARHSS